MIEIGKTPPPAFPEANREGEVKSPIRVMIVDGETKILRFIELDMKAVGGFDVILVTNVADVAEKLKIANDKKKPVQAILTEQVIGSHEEGGFEVGRIAKPYNIPVIMYSAIDGIDEGKFAENGISGWLYKSAHPEEIRKHLIEAIKQFPKAITK